jgi:uncharacterized protein
VWHGHPARATLECVTQFEQLTGPAIARGLAKTGGIAHLDVFYRPPHLTWTESPMIDKELLAILVCPKDHSPLSAADDQMIVRVNRAIAAGRIKNQAGRLVEQPIAGGLLRADGTLLYPIHDGIPLLVPDEAISVAEI